MCNSKLLLQTVTFLACISFGRSNAAENSAGVNQPQLIVQSSKYIDMKSSSLLLSGGSPSFRGAFIVLGEGVYGHFDLIAFNDSGKEIQQTKSDNRAYRKHQGNKLKSIGVDLGSDLKCTKVEVSFHEMRVNPNVGACVPK
jgi:hypothetical protein